MRDAGFVAFCILVGFLAWIGRDQENPSIACAKAGGEWSWGSCRRGQ